MTKYLSKPTEGEEGDRDVEYHSAFVLLDHMEDLENVISSFRVYPGGSMRRFSSRLPTSLRRFKHPYQKIHSPPHSELKICCPTYRTLKKWVCVHGCKSTHVTCEMILPLKWLSLRTALAFCLLRMLSLETRALIGCGVRQCKLVLRPQFNYRKFIAICHSLLSGDLTENHFSKNHRLIRNVFYKIASWSITLRVLL